MGNLNKAAVVFFVTVLSLLNASFAASEDHSSAKALSNSLTRPYGQDYWITLPSIGQSDRIDDFATANDVVKKSAPIKAPKEKVVSQQQKEAHLWQQLSYRTLVWLKAKQRLGDRYSIHLFTAKRQQLGAYLAYAEQLNSKMKMYSYHRTGEAMGAALYGSYQTIEAARAAKKTMAANWTKQKPVIRTLSGIEAELDTLLNAPSGQ